MASVAMARQHRGSFGRELAHSPVLPVGLSLTHHPSHIYWLNQGNCFSTCEVAIDESTMRYEIHWLVWRSDLVARDLRINSRKVARVISDVVIWPRYRPPINECCDVEDAASTF